MEKNVCFPCKKVFSTNRQKPANPGPDLQVGISKHSNGKKYKCYRHLYYYRSV